MIYGDSIGVFYGDGSTKLFQTSVKIPSKNNVGVYIDSSLASSDSFDILDRAILFKAPPLDGVLINIQYSESGEDFLLSPSNAFKVSQIVDELEIISDNIDSVLNVDSNITDIKRVAYNLKRGISLSEDNLLEVANIECTENVSKFYGALGFRIVIDYIDAFGVQREDVAYTTDSYYDMFNTVFNALRNNTECFDATREDHYVGTEPRVVEIDGTNYIYIEEVPKLKTMYFSAYTANTCQNERLYIYNNGDATPYYTSDNIQILADNSDNITIVAESINGINAVYENLDNIQAINTINILNGLDTIGLSTNIQNGLIKLSDNDVSNAIIDIANDGSISNALDQIGSNADLRGGIYTIEVIDGLVDGLVAIQTNGLDFINGIKTMYTDSDLADGVSSLVAVDGLVNAILTVEGNTAIAVQANTDTLQAKDDILAIQQEIDNTLINVTAEIDTLLGNLITEELE